MPLRKARGIRPGGGRENHSTAGCCVTHLTSHQRFHRIRREALEVVVLDAADETHVVTNTSLCIGEGAVAYGRLLDGLDAIRAQVGDALQDAGDVAVVVHDDLAAIAVDHLEERRVERRDQRVEGAGRAHRRRDELRAHGEEDGACAGIQRLFEEGGHPFEHHLRELYQSLALGECPDGEGLRVCEAVRYSDGHPQVDHHQSRVAQFGCGGVEGSQVGFDRFVGNGENFVQIVDLLAKILRFRSGGVFHVLPVLRCEIAQRRVQDAPCDGPSRFCLYRVVDARCCRVERRREDAAPVQPIGFVPDGGHHARVAGQRVDVHVVAQPLARIEHPDRHAVGFFAVQRGPQPCF